MAFAKYEKRFLKWMNSRAISVQEFSYERPSAQGDVYACLMKPSSMPQAYVVFVHGTGNDLYFPYLNLFQCLLATGFAVFTFDLDGHGRNSTTLLDKENILTALPQAIDHLQRHTSIGSFHLLGHSLGAALAFHYLKENTDTSHILSYTGIAMPISIPLPFKPPWQEGLSILRSSMFRQLQYYSPWEAIPAGGRFKRTLFPIRIKAGEDHSTYYYVSVIAQILEAIQNQPGSFQIQPNTRMLFINGERDFIAPAQDIERLMKTYPSAQLKVCPGETHYTTSFSPQTEKWLISHLK